MNEIEESLQLYLIEQSAQLLDIEQSDVQWEDDIDEYGFDSMEVNRLCVQINEHFDIFIQPVLFLELTSLEQLSEHLLEEFSEQIEQKLLGE